MEKTTKRIIAIAIIVTIASAGIGAGVWWILLPEEEKEQLTNPYEYPGLASKPPLAQTLKIGLLDGMGFTGAYSWGGAWIAAKDINELGGVDIGGTTYYIGLIREDTNEHAYDYDTATAAAIKMVEHNPHAILGGFRSDRKSVV